MFPMVQVRVLSIKSDKGFRHFRVRVNSHWLNKFMKKKQMPIFLRRYLLTDNYFSWIAKL